MNILTHIYATVSKWLGRIPAEDWQRLWDAGRKVVADAIAPPGAAPTPQPQPQTPTGDLFGE